MRSSTPFGGNASQTVNGDGSITLSADSTVGDSGFYVRTGKLKNLRSVAVDSPNPNVELNLYFDKNDDGQFFTWNGDTLETVAPDEYAFADDEVRGSGGFGVDNSTTFDLQSAGDYTLAELKQGAADGIDGNTKVAVWIGINAPSSGTRTATVDDVSINGPLYVNNAWSGSPGDEVEPGKILGYNAFGTIQNAVVNARPGDTILVGPGTYKIEESIVIDEDNIKLLSNNATIEVVAEGSYSTSTTALAVDGDNVTVSGFEFADFLPRDGANAISLSGVEDATIIENTFIAALGDEDDEDEWSSTAVLAYETTGDVEINENNFVVSGPDVFAVHGSTAQDEVNATHNYWGAPSGPSGAFNGSGAVVSENVTVEPFYADSALETLNTDEDAPSADIIVDADGTTAYSSIQAAVDAANEGETIEVAAGTYKEDVTIETENITLESTAGADSTKISADAHEGVMIKSSGVTVRGFTVTTNLNDTGSHGQYGIRVEPPGDVENILIEDNVVENISDAYRPSGISLDLKNTADSNADDVTVRHNTVRNITSVQSGEYDAVAKAINPNERFDNLTVRNNTIRKIGNEHSAGAIGIDFSSDTDVTPHKGPTNFTIAQNDIDGITVNDESYGAAYKDGLALYLHEYGDLGDGYTVNQNIFRDGAVNYNTAGVTSPDTLNATHNYWGAPSGPSGDYDGYGSSVSKNVSVEPFYTGANLTTLSTESTPTGIVVDDDGPSDFDSIQAAVNTASDGDRVTVKPGTYNETVTVNTANVTLVGPNAGTPGNDDRSAEATINGQLIVEADDVTVDGFDVSPPDATGNKNAEALRVSGNADDVVIQNNVVRDFGEDGLAQWRGVDAINVFGGSESDAVENVTITDNLVDGISGRDTEGGTTGVSIQGNVVNATVRDNTVTNVGQEATAWAFGITVRGTENHETVPTNVEVVDNNVSNVLSSSSTSTSGVGIGLESGSASDVTFSENEISNAEFLLEDKTATVDLRQFIVNNTIDRGVLLAGAEFNEKPPRNVIFGSIQDAVDAAEREDTLQAEPGTYEESVTIDTKNVTLESTDGADVTKISADARWGVQIESSGVTVRDFTVTTNKDDTGTYGQYGIRVLPTTDVDDILIEGNTVENISDTYRPAGITIDLQHTPTGSADNVIIRDNTVRNITSVENATYDAVAKGINPNGGVNNLTVENNRIRNIGNEHSAGANAIDFSSNASRTSPNVGPTNFTITKNEIDGLTIGEGNPNKAFIGPPHALYFHEYGNLGDEHRVTENAFRDGDVRYNTEGVTDPDTLNATHNYWGDSSGPSGVAPGHGVAVTGNVDYRPWLEADGTVNKDSVTFHVSEDGADSNNGSAAAPFATIDAALDAAQDGDTVFLRNGTYDRSSQLTITTNNVTILGESREGVTINSSDVAGYGMATPTGGEVTGLTVHNLTMVGPQQGGAADYAFKIQPTTENVTISQVDVVDSQRTGIDFNGVHHAGIFNVTVSNTSSGNGIALADSRHILVDNATVENNAWGGIALYTNDQAHQNGLENGTHDVTITNSEFANNSGIGLYAQNTNRADNPFENIVVVANEFRGNDVHVAEKTHPDTNVIKSSGDGWFDFDMVVGANDFGEATMVRTSAGAPSVPAVFSSIQAGETAASPGELVFVESGTYDEFVDIGTNNVTLIGMDGATIAPSDETIANQNSRAWLIDMRGHSNVTIKGLAFEGNSTDSLIAVAVNGEDATVWNTSIENVKTGIQTHSKWDLENSTFGASSSDGALLGSNDIQNVEFGISIQSNDANVVNNTVTDAHSGIAVLNGRDNVQVVENQFSDLNETAVGISDAYEKNNSTVTSGAVAVHENDLTGGTDGVNNSAGVNVNAAFNYWGAVDGPSGEADGSGVAVSDNVTYAPYYTDAAMTTVETPGSTVSTGFTVSNTEPLTSEIVDVDVTVENTGEFAAKRTITLVVDGSNTSTTEDVRLTPGKRTTVTLPHQFTTTGEHTVTVYDGKITLSPKTVTAEAASNPNAAVDITAPSDSDTVGDSDVTVEYDLSNVDTGINHTTVTVDDGSPEVVALGERSETLTNLSEGEHTVEVALVNNAGSTVTSDSVTFDVDTTLPVVSIEPARTHAIGANNPVEIDLAVEDPNFADASFVVLDGGNPIYGEDLSDELADGEATISWDGTNASGPLASGEYELLLQANDTSNNLNKTSTTVSVDNDAPTVADPVVNDTDLGSGDTVEVSVDPTDDETSVENVTVTLVADDVNFRTTADATNNSGTWTATFDATALDVDGSYTVNAAAMDVANNVDVGSNSSALEVDTTAPSVSAVLDTENTTHGYVNVTVSDDVSEDDIEVNLTGPNDPNISTLSSSGTNRYSGTFPLASGSNDYSLEANATDDAGNLGETTATANISAISTAQEGDTISVTGDDGTVVEFTLGNDLTDGQAALTSSRTPLAELGTNVGSTFLNGELNQNLTDAISNATIRIPVSGNVPPGKTAEQVNISRYNEATGQWEQFPTTIVTVNERDYFQTTVEHFSTYGPVAPDTTAPTIDGTSLSPTASGNYDYGTDQVAVTVEYSDNNAIDAGNVTVYFDGSNVTSNTDTTISGSETTFTANDDLAGSGQHWVNVTVVDTAGNVQTENVSFTVTEDVDSPNVTLVQSSFDYGTDPVGLKFTYDDSPSGIDTSSVQFAVNGQDQTGPAVVASTGVQYDAGGLASNTTHTATLNVSDNDGNWNNATYTFELGADTEEPNVTDVSFAPNTTNGVLPGNTNSATVTIQYDDALSGIDRGNVSVEYDGSDVTGSAVITDSELEYTAIGLTVGSTHTLTAEIPDKEGNTHTETVTVEVGSEFTNSVTIPADGEFHSIAFPAPVNGTVSEVFGDVDGVVYAYDGNSWQTGPDIADQDVDALDAFAVKLTGSKSDLEVDFQYRDDDSVVQSMATADLDAGWNFVGAPQASGWEDAFAATTGGTVERVVNSIGAPENVPYGLSGSTELVGPSTVGPYQGYWVFVTDDGTLAATVPVDPTPTQEENALDQTGQ